METTSPNRVPFWVNLLLTLAFIVQALALFLFHRRDITKREAHISTLPFTRDHKFVELATGITAVAIAIILSVWILRVVWNRVISPLLGVRGVSFSEAYAVTILFFAITTWMSP